jgi:hypothetical protein
MKTSPFIFNSKNSTLRMPIQSITLALYARKYFQRHAPWVAIFLRFIAKTGKLINLRIVIPKKKKLEI